MANFFKIKNDILYLQGNWISENIAEIEKALPKQKYTKIEASELKLLDTSGAYILNKHFPKTELQNFSDEQQKIIQVVTNTKIENYKKPARLRALSRIGKWAIDSYKGAIINLSFMGELFVCLFSNLLRPYKIRITAITHQVMQAGIKAIPLVMLISFLIAVVLVYQGSIQLRKFGADIFIVDLIGISVLREMGVLLTAIMIAGRSGSAFTAEIGVMKVNEEIDAMKTIGLNPMEVVVLPRVLALIILLPALTLIANIFGFLGGAVAANALLDIPYQTFFDRAQSVIATKHFWVGIIKAPVFGLIIAAIASMRGMQVSGSSESVGRLTTQSVVESIFMVFIADAIFSILFVEWGY